MVRVSSGGAFPAGENNDEPSGPAAGGTAGLPSSSPTHAAGLTARAHDAREEPQRRKRMSFRSRPAETQRAITDEDVLRAVALLEDAQRADVDMSARDLAWQWRIERPPLARRGIEAARRALPLTRTRSERVSRVEQYQQRRVEGQDEDRRRGETMTHWLEGLDAEQCAQIEVVSSERGTPHWLQPVTMRVSGQPALEFDAAHGVNWPAQVLAALPEQARAQIDARSKIWSALDIDSSAEATALIDEHFERMSFDASGPLPLEVKRLVELDPEMAQTLEALEREGARLSLVRCKSTPAAVLDAIRFVAENSQHNFVSSWLPAWIGFDIEPEVHDGDVEKLRSDAIEHEQSALKKVDESSFRGKVLAHQLEKARTEAPNFERQLALIQAFSRSVMCVSATTTAASAQGASPERLDALNAKLHDTFGREYALRRMTFDDANRTSEGAQTIIKSLAVMAPLVEIIQNALHLGPLAKSLAAAGDDALSEGAELSALRGAGMTNQELRARLKIIGPAGAVALAMAGAIDEVMQNFGDHVGGAMYSGSAVFLSFVTGVLSIKYFANRYRELEREGKLPAEHVLDAESRRVLDEFSSLKMSKRDLLQVVDDSLERSGATPPERAAVHARLSRFSERRLMRRLRKEGALLPRRTAMAAGVKEAVGVNPARLGLMFGTLTSPAMGFALGPEFLHQPVLYAIAGSYETIVGALSIWAYGRSFDSRWKHFVKRTKPLDAADDSAGQAS